MPKKPGPMRTPSNVVELRGNPSRLSAEEIEERKAEEVPARPMRPAPPADLLPYARECWDRLVPELDHLGLLTTLDRESLEMACNNYALAKYALEEMRPRKGDGTIDKRTRRPEVLDIDKVHGGMFKKHPAAAIFFQAQREFRAWCIEFGLSPSARASLRPAAGQHGGGGSARDGEDDDAFFGT